jgi:outer membrane protein
LGGKAIYRQYLQFAIGYFWPTLNKMSIMFRSLIIAGFLLIFSQASQAQESWSLEKCIEYALQNNIQVKQTMLSVESAQRNKKQSFANMFPSANASTGYNLNFGRTIDPGTNAFVTESVSSQNVWLGSSVTLFNGLRLLNGLKQSQLNVLAAEYDLQSITNDISMSVATSFLQVMFSEELLQIAFDQKGISTQMMERTQKLVDAGATAKGNLFDIKAQLANDEVQVVNSENNYQSAVLTLKQLLNLKEDVEFKVERPDVDMPITDPASLRVSMIYNDALENWPAVLARETRVLGAEKGVKMAWASLTPSLDASGNVNTVFSSSRTFSPFDTDNQTKWGEKIPYGTQLDQNLSYGLGMSLSIPIFNGLAAKNGLQQARLSKLNNELQLSDTKNQLYSSVQKAYNDAMAAYRSFLATDESVKAGEESFHYAEERFEVGMINAMDHSTIKNNLARVKSDRLRAKYDYIFRSKVLDFYRGKPLTFQLQ